MKTSWIVGVIMLYVTIFIYGSILANNGDGLFAMSGNLSVLKTAEGLDVSNPVTAAYSIIVGVWAYLKIFLGAVVLWFPGVWTGNWLYVYFVLCVPICIGMVVGVIIILRGTSSS